METPWTAGPLWSLAVLVLVAGVVKLGRPASARNALRAAELPAPAIGVRLLGAVEVLLAVWVVVEGSAPAAVLLGATELGFAVFSARLLTVQGGRVSCGCFGEASAPTSPVHVVVNLVGAALAMAAAAWPPGPITDVLGSQPFAAIPFLALVGLATWVWYALLVTLPEVLDAVATVRDDGGWGSGRGAGWSGGAG